MKLTQPVQFSFCTQLLLAACVLILSFGAQAEEAVPTIEAPQDTTSPSLYLKSAASHFNAPLLDTTLDIAVSGMVAKVRLTQSFHNTSAEWVEGRYTFPLPDQAAVNSLVVRIGDRKIVGSVREKKEAEKRYEQAKQAGQVASFVKQSRPNLFSSKFANIPPGETVTVELGYIQTIRYENSQYGLRVPLTLTQRYSNSLVVDKADVSSPQITRSVLDANESPTHRVSINATFFATMEESQIESPSHALSITRDNEKTQITLIEKAYLDRDFILQWRESAALVPLVQAWREVVGDEQYLLATVTPPINKSDIPEQARELILVIDTSGSMGGESIRAAKAALLDALSGLKPSDKFNIIEFNSSYTTLFSSPEFATDDFVDRAMHFTNNLMANGGTEMMQPMRVALKYKKSELLRQVVFITDGAIGYEEDVFKTVTDNLGNTRLFTVGIGTAPNQWFMRKVAEAGRGTHHLIQDINQVQSGMSQLLRKLEAPALTTVRVLFDGKQADIIPNPVPDLYAGEPLIIAAKLTDDNHTMTVAGQWGDEQWLTTLSVDNAPLTNTGLSSVWAKNKIESLQDKQRFNSDPDFYRSLIIKLSLDHQILSPYTAFLAIEDQPIRPVTQNLVAKRIPNVQPAGQDSFVVPLPQGSAGIDTLFLFSFLLMILSVGMLRRQPVRLATRRAS